MCRVPRLAFCGALVVVTVLALSAGAWAQSKEGAERSASEGAKPVRMVLLEDGDCLDIRRPPAARDETGQGPRGGEGLRVCNEPQQGLVISTRIGPAGEVSRFSISQQVKPGRSSDDGLLSQAITLNNVELHQEGTVNGNVALNAVGPVDSCPTRRVIVRQLFGNTNERLLFLDIDDE